MIGAPGQDSLSLALSLVATGHSPEVALRVIARVNREWRHKAYTELLNEETLVSFAQIVEEEK